MVQNHRLCAPFTTVFAIKPLFFVHSHSGFTRSAYDDLPAFNGPSFDRHKDIDHDYWTYLHYWQYLKHKSAEEYTGVETHVWAEIEAESIAWVPLRTSAALEQATADVANAAAIAAAKATSGSGNGNGSGGIDARAVDRMAAELGVLAKAVGAMQKGVAQLHDQHNQLHDDL